MRNTSKCAKEQSTMFTSVCEDTENIVDFTRNEISQFESGLNQEAAGEETRSQTSGAQGEKLPLVRSYYQFNTASCPKLRSEVWSGNLKYCAGRPRGNRLCRTFSFSRGGKLPASLPMITPSQKDSRCKCVGVLFISDPFLE